MRLYLDTSIWLDYFENRGKNGEEEALLIERAKQEGIELLYSDLHIIELKKLGWHNEMITKLFRTVSPVTRIHITRS